MKHTLHKINGVKWFYYRSRFCDEFPSKSKKYWWFLFDADREYVNCFERKSEMLKEIKHE